MKYVHNHKCRLFEGEVWVDTEKEICEACADVVILLSALNAKARLHNPIAFWIRHRWTLASLYAIRDQFTLEVG